MLPMLSVLASELDQLRMDQCFGLLGLEQQGIATFLRRIPVSDQVDDLVLMGKSVLPAFQAGG